MTAACTASLRRRAMRRLAGRVLCAITAGLIVAAGGARRVLAQESEPSVEAEPQVVQVQVALIYGAAQEGEVDEQLRGLRKFFASQLMPMRFGTLRMMSVKNVKLHCGEWGVVDLPEGVEEDGGAPVFEPDGEVDAIRPGKPPSEPAALERPDRARPSVRFLPIQIVDQRLHLHFSMPRMSTRLQLRSGRPLIAGGPPYQDGLIIVQLTPTFEAQEPGALAPAPAPDVDLGSPPAAPRGSPAPRRPAGRWVNDGAAGPSSAQPAAR
jgi:hypothetical protein